MAFSILGLLGCSKVDDDIADRVVKKLEEKYDGEFEVTALGNRFGTATNDTVTTYVREKNNDVVFEVVMDNDDNIEFEDYPRRKLAKELESQYTEVLDKEGINSVARLDMISEKAVQSVEISLSESIDSHSPKYFVGDVILEENENMKPDDLIQAYESLYNNQLKKTPLQTNIWIISSDNFDQAVQEFNENPWVSDAWYDDYDVVNNFLLVIEEEGIVTDNEEIKRHL